MEPQREIAVWLTRAECRFLTALVSTYRSEGFVMGSLVNNADLYAKLNQAWETIAEQDRG